MVNAKFENSFKRSFFKIKDRLLMKKIWKQIYKIRDNPAIGKPMRFSRKGTRELYVKPFRISYVYIKEGETVVFLDIYHKDSQ